MTLKFFQGIEIGSLPILEPIQRASVFLSLSLRPETFPNSSSILSEKDRDSIDPSKISVVSSAYWLILISLLFTKIPFISDSFG